jgi:leucyl aminopeptidase
MIRMVLKPKKKASKVVSLVGKGVTFDSGGLSIKPAGSMEDMKMDMGGAAAVLGAMHALAVISPKVEVRGYIPTTENMINGKATRPGDVVRAMSGKSIEILNTDAEGRLILADALNLAEKDGSDIIVDLATLTGACMVALGNDYAGLFSDDDKLVDSLMKASALAGERLWRLPLAPEYKKLIESPIADIKNTGGRYGGAITGALFLQHFVSNPKTKWAHLDIAGPAYADGDAGHIRKGGVGFGVRTLINFVRGL